MTWRTARLTRNDGAAFYDRPREMLIVSSRLGAILLVAGINSGFWILAIMLWCYMFGINMDTTYLTVVGLIVMAISVAGLAVLTLERR